MASIRPGLSGVKRAIQHQPLRNQMPLKTMHKKVRNERNRFPIKNPLKSDISLYRMFRQSLQLQRVFLPRPVIHPCKRDVRRGPISQIHVS